MVFWDNACYLYGAFVSALESRVEKAPGEGNQSPSDALFQVPGMFHPEKKASGSAAIFRAFHQILRNSPERYFLVENAAIS